MKQRYSETSRRSLRHRLRTAVRSGGAQQAVGGALILLLALAGGIGGIFADTLSEGTVPERHHPPYNAVLQALLYHPENRLQPVSEQQDTGPLFGTRIVRVSAGAGADDEASSPRILSRPWYTAVIGQPYRYDLRAEGPSGEENSGALTYDLLEGPRGMKIDDETGQLTWTPESDHQGEHSVSVAAYAEDGAGLKQTFDLYVGKTAHPLGTDWRGRDMSAALLLGARWALLPGCIAVLVSMLLGTLVGGLAGYYEGRMDDLLSYVSDLTEAVPSLVLLFLAAVIFRYNLFLIMLVVGVILFPQVATAVKSKVQSLKTRQFVESSQELGLRDRVILWRDIVWYNARPQLLLQASGAFVFAIIVEVTLSYLNLSLQNEVSWGNLLKEGKEPMLNQDLYGPVMLTALAVILAVAAFYLFADGIRRRYGMEGA
jgi:peptide/nickel transport system permease protein